MRDNIIGWQILAESELEYMTFPIQLSDGPVSDEKIKHYIKKHCKRNKVQDTRAEIMNLVFLGIDLHKKEFCIEDLDPIEFWPSDEELEKSSIRLHKGGEE